MIGYTPLFSKIVDSSLWMEPDFVVKVFLTMLAKKDGDNVVRGSAFNISQWAKKTEQEVLEALKILSSPDTRRLEPQPFEGRRIEKVEEGWLILNGATYQSLMVQINRRAYKAKHEAGRRAKAKGVTMATSGTPLPGETAFVKAEAAGASQEVLDGLSAPAAREGGSGGADHAEPPMNPLGAGGARRHSIPTVEEVIGVGVTRGISEEDCRAWHKDRAVEGWADRNGCDIGNWRAYLLAFRDRKRVSGGSGNGIRPPSTVNELRVVKEAKEKLADRLKLAHACDDGWTVKWKDQEAKIEYQTLRREIGELTAQIAGSR